MNYSAENLNFEKVSLLGKEALFCDQRVEAVSLPDGLFLYYLRGSDKDFGEPVSLEKNVLVNYCGSIIVNQPFEKIETNGYIEVTGKINFKGEEGRISDFKA